MKKMQQPLKTLLDFANETAYLAGKITLRHYQANPVVDIKMDGTVVTIADQESEKLIRSRIERYFPDHAILGEEYGEKQLPESKYCWIIDPIDGTQSFIHGVPLYAVLIGLEVDNQVAAGVAHFPALGETISAASGEGCYWNSIRAHVSEIDSLAESLVLCNDSEAMYEDGHGEAWDRLKKACKVRRGWGDAYGYLLVATGRAELMLDPRMNLWDCGPFPPIFKEAGGYFGDWKGNRGIYGGEALATSSKLLPEVLDIINRQDESTEH
jgi:histidinol-phosphatase